MTNGIAPTSEIGGMSFAEWLAQVLARWKLIAWTVVILVVLTIVTSLVADPIYRGRASFLAVPNKANPFGGSGGGLASLLGGGASGLAQSFGIGLSSDPTTSPEFYKELVASRELLTHLATATYKDPRKPPEGHGTATLVELIGPHRWPTPERRLEVTVIRLGKLVRASPDTKTNLITVTADLEWPELAARVANHATALVDTFNVQQRQSRARWRRIFAEAQAQEAQGSLRSAEDRLRDFQQTNRQYQQSPELTFEQARLRRQLDVEQEVYLGVRRELETSRLDEVNDVPVITVVDSAIAPTFRQFPKRTVMTVSSVFVGLFLGVLIAGTLALVGGWAERNRTEAEDLRVALDDIARSLPLRRRIRAPVSNDQ
jgi:tyrosine-protein kinase Etk/Wzc